MGKVDQYPDESDYVHWLRLLEWEEQRFFDDLDIPQGVWAPPDSVAGSSQASPDWPPEVPPGNRPQDVSEGCIGDESDESDGVLVVSSGHESGE